MFRIRDRIKAEKVLERVRQALDVPFELSVFEPYWKDKALWECSFSVKIAGGSDAEVAFACLTQANRLGNWLVSPRSGRQVPAPGLRGDLQTAKVDAIETLYVHGRWTWAELQPGIIGWRSC